MITGIGPVSAIGFGVDSFWTALVAGTSGIGPITRCDVSRSPSKVGAEVKDFSIGRAVTEWYGRGLSRAVQLGIAAAIEAIDDSGLTLDGSTRDRFGVYAGTSVGNLDRIFSLRDQWTRGVPISRQTSFQVIHHAAACVIGSLLDLTGPTHTTSTGCNSGMDALGHAAQAIALGVVDGMIVVGTDSELVPEIMAALNRSSSLATRWNDQPARASRPFDRDRDGNVIGEGAAAFVVESIEHATRRGARVYAEVAGYAVRSAGRRRYDPASPDMNPEVAAAALRTAMQQAGWGGDRVDAVNANGSSSRSYDAIEGQALGLLFGGELEHVHVHSIKGALGQHGAGSSALQVAAGCLTIARGVVPPTLNCDQLDPACGPLPVVRTPISRPTSRVLVHSIGLGGFYYSAMALQRNS